MLDNQGHRHTFRICNTYCFSTTTVFTRTRPHLTLYVDGLSCSSSVYRHTVTQIPIHTNAVRYQSRRSGERREYQVRSPALFRRTTHLQTHLVPCTAPYCTLSLLSCPRSTTALTGWLDRSRLSVRYICHVPGHIAMDILYVSVIHLDFRRRGAT